MPDPKLVISGDTSGAVAAITALERRVEALENKLKRVKAPKAPVSEPGAFDTAISGVGRYVTATAAAAVAVKAITAEWNNVIDRQRKAAQTTLTFEEALGEAALNVGSILPPERMKALALKMSAETGAAPATAVTALSLAIKSGGATTPEEAERLGGAAFVAGKLSPRAAPEKLADTSGSLASYMARTGASAEEAGGVLLSMQSKSNIADANKAMAAMGPTLANMLAQGASVQMAQALAPALSQAIEDTQGDVSSLAATQFTTSLTDAFGGRARAAGRKDVPDFAIEQLRGDPALAREFFQGTMKDAEGKAIGKPELGRGKAETFFRAIAGDVSLAGDEKIIGSYVRQFEEYKKGALTSEQGGQFFSERLSQVHAATPTVQAERILRGVADRSRLQRGEGMTGAVRENLKDVLQASGQADLFQKMEGVEFDFSRKESRYKAADLLERRAAAIERGGLTETQEAVGRAGLRAVPFIGPSAEALIDALRPTTEISERDRETAAQLREAAAALKTASENFTKRNRNGNVEQQPVGPSGF